MVLKFHEQIIGDLIEDTNGGGLVILSSGLSLPKLLAAFLSLQSSAAAGSLLLLHSPHLSASLKSLLLSFSPDLPLSDISAELPAAQRLHLYSSGRILLVSPRILIVDLLTQKAPASLISGVVLITAHSLSESSTESFIVRILKSLNKNVAVYAFSDKPYAMVSGFSKTERIMKSFFIKKLHIWPRFHVNVSEELERDPPVVVDIRVPMTKYMVGIQKAVVEVLDACLKEMRKTNKVDVEDLTVENGLFKSFDEIVRRQLDPIWHTLGKKTKQLVSDMKTLRKLLDYLVRYDAVSYLKYLDTLRVSESFRSVWIFAESSFKIFDYAKKRVFGFVRSDGVKVNEQKRSKAGKKRKSESNDSGEGVSETSRMVLEETLEEPPKWKVLREILQEVEDERRCQPLAETLLDNDDNNGIVLVACKDERSCMQLEDCIMNSPEKAMQDEWEKYLLSKVELRKTQTPQKKKHKSVKGYGILDGVIPVSPAQDTEVSIACKQEYEALLAAASVIRAQTKKEDGAPGNVEPEIEGSGCNRVSGKEKNKKKKKMASFNSKMAGKKDNFNDRNVVLNDNSEVSGSKNENDFATENVSGSCSHSDDAIGQVRSKKLPPIHFHAMESCQPILDILKPSVIIVYHPDVTFVREIEVYKAENPTKGLKVYFLFYENSTEVQKFEAAIRRENSAFESLIRQKSMMMIPVDQDGFCLGLNSYGEPQASSTQNSVTRKAGGRKESEKEMQVIVDMREFMSSLPNVLHQKGMRIIPVTLEVGDYILSPLICVERKSIQDLFMSFTSGRLYHQVEMMVRYYRIPVLLIEFSQDKSFSFQSVSDIGDDVTPYNIISKLSLLILHFPRLRIIWSRSLHATAEIFACLKANQDEPDEAKATRVGVPSEEGIIENDVRAENYNTSAVEFLRRLPGVTDANYRAIMDGCNSLAELALLRIERLSELMGGRKPAQTLRDFLDAKYPTLL